MTAPAKHEFRRNPAQVTDARGRRVALLDPYTLWLARRHDMIPAEALGAIAREIGFGLVRGQRVLFAVSVVCLGIVLVAVAERGVEMLLHETFSLLGLMRTASLFTTVWAGPLVFWLGARRIRLQRTRRTMLKHLRCPHCGYDLRLLPTDPVDGATVCPECGCAWRLEDARSAESTQDGGRPSSR